jgi:hypothetical protein
MVCGKRDAMENNQTERKRPKSTILLLLFIFILFNAGMIFRAGINTLYFTEDTSSDYAPVQATVKKLQPDTTVKEGKKPRITPIFSFVYKGEELTMEAPRLAFSQAQKGQTFKQGEEHTLWVHKNRGELILPPKAGLQETGRSQLLISAVFLLLAIVIWIVRNRFGAKARR